MLSVRLMSLLMVAVCVMCLAYSFRCHSPPRALTVGLCEVTGERLRVPSHCLLVQLDSVGVSRQHVIEHNWCKHRRPEQRPNGYGKEVLAHHVRGHRHLSDQICKLRSANHGPSNHELWGAHEKCTAHLCGNARPNAHERTLPESIKRHQLGERNRKRDGAGEEDTNHPSCEALCLCYPDFNCFVGLPATAFTVLAVKCSVLLRATPVTHCTRLSRLWKCAVVGSVHMHL